MDINQGIEICKQYIIDSFKDLEFIDTTHEYFINGESYPSVSSVLGRFYYPFDEISVSEGYALKNNMTQEQVLTMWHKKRDDSVALGTRVHDFAEHYCWDRTMEPSDGYEQAVLAFFKSIPYNYRPVLTETKVYSRVYKYAGTFDLLLIDVTTGKLVIVDYKTNIDLYKNFRGKRMKRPFDMFKDCPLSKYFIQLSLYRIPLMEINLDVSAHLIIWLRGDGTFQTIQGYNLYNDLVQVL